MLLVLSCFVKFLLLRLLLRTLQQYVIEHQGPQKKTVLSLEEQTFLCYVLALDTLSPRQKHLYEAAKRIYGNRVKQLEPTLGEDITTDENGVKEKALSHLRDRMENFHYSITQLAFNMGKLAGNYKIKH